MGIGELSLRATIWASLLAWVVSELLRGESDEALRRARLAWTVGALAVLAHSALAFHIRYAWDHEAALRDAARQIASVTSLDWARGFFVNYVFLAAWAAHAAAWWTSIGLYRRRRGLDLGMRGFALFMFLNGAIVFGRGPVQWVGLVAVLAVFLAWYRLAVAPRARTVSP